MTRNGRKPHDDAGYRKRRKQLMASITPRTRCGRCGRLFSEHPRHKNGKRGRWEVGHVLDGNNLGPLVLEHSTCNRQAGGRLGYARGAGRARHAIDPHWPYHYNLDDPESVGAPPCVRAGGGLCATCAAWRAQDQQTRR